MTKEEIREYRENVLKMSRPRLAREMGYSNSATIYGYESGIFDIPANYEERIKKITPLKDGDPDNPQKRRTDEQMQRIDDLIVKYHSILSNKQIADKLGENEKYIRERKSTLKKKGKLK